MWGEQNKPIFISETPEESKEKRQILNLMETQDAKQKKTIKILKPEQSEYYPSRSMTPSTLPADAPC